MIPVKLQLLEKLWMILIDDMDRCDVPQSKELFALLEEIESILKEHGSKVLEL